MTNSNHVEQVTVTVTLANGEQHTLTCHRPSPSGSNPRFIGQQIEVAMRELGARLDRLADTYANQIRA